MKKIRWSALFSAASMGVDPVRPMTPYETLDILDAVNGPAQPVREKDAEQKEEPPQAF